MMPSRTAPTPAVAPVLHSQLWLQVAAERARLNRAPYRRDTESARLVAKAEHHLAVGESARAAEVLGVLRGR